MAHTILEGSTFCICDERGDIDGDTHGLFADDTRFLSLLRLTVNGAKPLLLSSGVVEYFSAVQLGNSIHAFPIGFNDAEWRGEVHSRQTEPGRGVM